MPRAGRAALVALITLLALNLSSARAAEDGLQGASATHGPNTIIEVDAPPIRMQDPNRGIPMPGMDMVDDRPSYLLRVNQLEFVDGAGSRGYAWDAEGYAGGDLDKLWIKTSGQHLYGKTEDARVEALWSHAYQTYWNWQLGVRHDFGHGPGREWLAAGVQGLAPYFVHVEATAYAGPSGRTAVRLRTDHDFLLTQRLFVTPEAELNAYGKPDPGREIGSGLSDLRLGVRVRYEIRREMAPYIGVVFGHRFGQTAAFASRDGEPTNDREIVVGVRFWY